MALPISLSRTIIVGQAIGEHAFLTDDKTGIYTETTIRVDQIIKQNDANPLHVGDIITTDRWGGAVRLPSGRIKTVRFNGWGFPNIGDNYVWFLITREDDSDYVTYTGYNIEEGVVDPLDSCYPFEQYAGLSATKLISLIKEKLPTGGQQQ